VSDLDVPVRLVGRTEELDRLRTALAAARDGSGGAVLVTGEAGIGKTRLVSELAQRARRAGAVVLVGHCIDLVGTGLPYLAVIEALQPLRGSPALAEGVSELARLSPDLVGAEPTGETAPEEDRQRRLFEEVRALLGRLSAATPVVLILEDLHWADLSTLDLACYLAHTIGGSRLLLVATYRDDETRAGDPLPRAMTSLLRAPTAGRLRLGPLSRAEVTAILQQNHEAGLPVDVLDSVAQRSEGNPFFAEELLAAAARGDGELPLRLRDTLQHHLSPLDADTLAVLRVAAAIGRNVSYDRFRAVVRLPEARLARALRRAVDARVLVADPSAGAFRFRHALLAEVVYAALIPGEREEVHGQVAQALERDGAAEGELALHWAAAGRVEQALAASAVAARDAEARSGRAEALAHLERVLALWPVVERAADLAGEPLPQVLGRAAELAHLTGRGRRAAELIRWALELPGAAAPVEAASLHERLGTYLLPTGDRDAGLAAFARAVELVPARPPSRDRVRVLAALGQASILSARFTDAKAASEEAIRVAEALGDTRPPRALDVLGNALCYLGREGEGLKLLADGCAREPAGLTPPDLVRPHVYRSDALLALGRAGDALRVARDGLDLARGFGITQGVGNVLASNAAEALLRLGDWDAAEEVLAEAIRSGSHFWAYQPHCRRAELAIGRGEADAARHHLDMAAQAALEPAAAVDYYCLVAELALWEGDLAAAAAAVDGGCRAASTVEVELSGARLCALGLRVEADRIQLAAAMRSWAAVDDARHRARALTEMAWPTVESPDVAAWRVVIEAENGRVEGRRDPGAWRAAVEAWDQVPRPYLAAYCRWRLAEALVGSPDGDPAVPAREAHRFAERLGARPLLHELGQLARRARFDLAAPTPPSRPHPYAGLGLTAREEEVLQLLAYGYTNSQIAAELHISAKTAGVHVSHILGKLGVSRRVEAAAIAQRLQADRGAARSTL
jgi:DNA-binding CsgD family transcriptional regulator/tetratricopeptide (TPR) repeat protein